MILRIIEAIGLNPELIADLMLVALIAQTLLIMAISSTLKGMIIPLLKAKYQKKNLAVVDIGGIETPLITYDRGSEELQYSHKENNFSWPIPDGIEKMLPNGIRYILASRHSGSTFNINLMGEDINNIKRLLSPKNQANIIDDRSKQISDRLTKDINKPMILATGIGIIFLIAIFGYLVFIKAVEYDLCAQAAQTAYTTAETTLTTLPPLD
jgi:hypothetical protein